MGKNNEKGMVLAMVVIIGAIAIMLGTALLTTSVVEVKHGNYYENDAHSFYVAKSAAEMVENAIVDGDITVDTDNGSIQTFSGTIGENTYNVDVNRDSSDNSKIIIHAVGDVKGVDDEVTLNLKESSENSEGYTIQTDMALFAYEDISIVGGANINGDVVSNNNVEINDSGKVNGNIYAYSNRTYFMLIAPDLPLAEDDIIGDENNFNAGIRDGEMRAGANSVPYTLYMNETGNISFDTIRIRGKELTINIGNVDRTIVVDNLISESGSGKLVVQGSGNLTIYVNNTISSSGGSTQFNDSTNCNQLRIIYNGDSTVTLDNNFKFYGLLYAINSTVYIKSHLQGAIIAKKIVADNGAKFTYNMDNTITFPEQSGGGGSSVTTYERINFQ
ncbi:MAG: DUF7305 domain-containing protein [Eubacteriales bacterium]